MKIERRCSIEGCNAPYHSKGYCNRHYQMWREHGDPLANHRYKNKRAPAVTRQECSILGPRPNPSFEKAIYLLRDSETSTPFYVGSTTRPVQRMARHRDNFGLDYEDVEMVITQCCPVGKEVYWESKLLVELIESGYELTNTNMPHSTVFKETTKINPDIKLDFGDVLLVPSPSSIKSRNDVDLLRTFDFRYSDVCWTSLPILSANMFSITTPEVAKVLDQHRMLACVPKGSIKSFQDLGLDNLIPSVGLGEIDKSLSEYGFITLDCPNAYIDAVVEQTKHIRAAFPNIILAVGNVVTPEQTVVLIEAGADIVKLGIGSGSCCSTRLKTGCGYPQFSAVVECSSAAHSVGGLVISDGGCVVPGDLAKAFAAGADFVMLGGMLAGHNENGEDFYGSSSERGAGEFAGGLKDYRAAEGWEMKLPDKGPIENTLRDLEGGLRSACSYVGAKSIEELSKKATFVVVNRTANTSLLEYRI